MWHPMQISFVSVATQASLIDLCDVTADKSIIGRDYPVDEGMSFMGLEFINSLMILITVILSPGVTFWQVTRGV